MSKHELLVCLAPVSMLGCSRVRGVDQKPDLELGSYTSPNEATLGPGNAFSEVFEIGSDGMEVVPVKLEWETAKDRAGCLRIKNATLRRTGGPRSTEVYEVKFARSTDRECVNRLDHSQESFERMQISYCWRWNGAVNKVDCAYSAWVTLNGDAVGLERRRKHPSSAK
jgi:hypothetical protein